MELKRVGTLVFFAVPQEARPFVRLWNHGQSPGGPLRSAESGVRNGRRYVAPGLEVWVSGMGQGNARRTVERALAFMRPESVLTCGLAGGLNPELRTGDLVADADAGFPWAGALPGLGFLPVTFHCAERVAATVLDKAELRRQSGADAVEMESGIIREVCRQRGIPGATLRVISDAAHEALPLDFGELVDADQQLQPMKLAGALLRRPGKIPALLRLGRTVNRSAGSLAEALVKLLRHNAASLAE